MAGQRQEFLKVSAAIFKVLAWVVLVLQVGMGLILLIGGGPAVPIAGVEVSARIVGVLNFLAAAIYWFFFMFISKMTALLLDLYGHVRMESPSP